MGHQYFNGIFNRIHECTTQNLSEILELSKQKETLKKNNYLSKNISSQNLLQFRAH